MKKVLALIVLGVLLLPSATMAIVGSDGCGDSIAVENSPKQAWYQDEWVIVSIVFFLLLSSAIFVFKTGKGSPKSEMKFRVYYTLRNQTRRGQDGDRNYVEVEAKNGQKALEKAKNPNWIVLRVEQIE